MYVIATHVEWLWFRVEQQHLRLKNEATAEVSKTAVSWMATWSRLQSQFPIDKINMVAHKKQLISPFF